MARRFIAFVLAAGLATAPLAAGAAPLKSPDQVKTALRLMMQVTNDFDRQITRKTYARLPHENMEFQEASEALRTAIAAEPAPFKAKSEKKITAALKAAQKTADESAAGQDAQLRADHAQMLKAVNAVFADYPADLRPDPNVQPGRPPGAPPHS
jgi:hypothetical protein